MQIGCIWHAFQLVYHDIFFHLDLVLNDDIERTKLVWFTQSLDGGNMNLVPYTDNAKGSLKQSQVNISMPKR